MKDRAVRCTFSLPSSYAVWVRKQAQQKKVSQSSIVRESIERTMQAAARKEKQ